MSDWREIPPPATMSVFHETRATLYTADGRPLVRHAGFVPPMRTNMAMQTTGTFPQLTAPKKTGKKGKGKRGC